jgi:hypothetical protein
MSKKSILDWQPNKMKKVIYHEEDGKNYIETRQDVTDLVDGAAMLRDLPVADKDFMQVAVIPEAVLNRSFTEGWFNDPKAWKRWANDPDNRDFRTGGGNL